MKVNSKEHGTVLSNISTNKKNFLERFEFSKGNVSSACIGANISRKTFYNYYNTDNEFKQSVDDLRESFLDFVEYHLFENIIKGNVTAQIYYLNNKGKSRGYNVQEIFEDDKPIFNP